MTLETNSPPVVRKLLFVTNSFSYGGSEKNLLEILKTIDVERVQVIILCIDSDPYTERLDGKLRTHVIVRVEKSLKSLRDWRRVYRAIGPDAVVLIYGTIWMLPWIAAAAARLAGIRNLYAIHHLMPVPPREPPVLKIKSPRDIWKCICGKRVRLIAGARIPPHLARATICVSDAVRNALIRQHRFPSQKMVTVRNGISLSEFAPDQAERARMRTQLGLGANDIVLVCSARLSPEKGIDILIAAMAQVVRDHPECKCLVIGEGFLREQLSGQIEELHLENNVSLLGFQAAVKPFLCAADAFILTSHVEGLPYSVLEAMACSLPCIVTNVGGNAEAVIQGVNGLVVEPGCVDAIAAAVLDLVTHPRLRAEMAAASRALAENKFDVGPRMREIRDLILS